MNKENNVPQAIKNFESHPNYVEKYHWRTLKDKTGKAIIYASLLESEKRSAVAVYDFYKSRGLLFNITVDLNDERSIAGLYEKHFHAWADLGVGQSFLLTYEEDPERPGIAVLTKVQEYVEDNNIYTRNLEEGREQAIRDRLIELGHPQEVLYEETVMYYLTNDEITVADVRQKPYITPEMVQPTAG